MTKNKHTREQGEQVLIEGWLLKKASHPKLRTSKSWNPRYFVLHGQTLSYSNQEDDPEKNSYKLVPGCTVGDVYLMEYKDKMGHNAYTSPQKYDHSDDPHADLLESKDLKHGKKQKGEKQKEYKYCIKISWPDTEDQKSPAHLPQIYKTDPNSNQPTPNKPTRSVMDHPPKPVSSPPQLLRAKSSKSYSKSPTQSNHIRRRTLDSVPSFNRRSTGQMLRHGMENSQIIIEDQKEGEEKTHGETQTDLSRHYTEQLQQQIIATEQAEEQLKALARAAKRASNKKTKKRMMKGTSVVAATGAVVTASLLTAGVSLVAGLLFVGIGAAAGGSGAVVTKSYYKYKHGHSLVLAAANCTEAETWKKAIEEAIRRGSMPSSGWTGIFTVEGRNPAEFLLPTSNGAPSRPEINRQSNTDIHWVPLEGGWTSGALGLRIFREEKEYDSLQTNKKLRSQLSVNGRPCPPLKAQVILNASPFNAFMCLMSNPQIRNHDINSDGTISPLSGQRASFRVVEQKDNNSDIIHLVFRPLYLFPSWTAPRDYCIHRYWRLEDDGSYMVCYDSVVHPDCPPCPPYVRGELNGIYSIAPRRRHGTVNTADIQEECLLTHIVQVDPRGWIPTMKSPYFGNQGYAEAFAVSSLLQMLDTKDALDRERFVTVSLDDVPPPRGNSMLSKLSVNQSIQHTNDSQLVSNRSADSAEDDLINYDFAYSGEVIAEETMTSVDQNQTISSHPTPLPTSMWAEPDANSFKVRGKLYKKDKKKYNAGQSMFRLIAVDFLEVSSIIMKGIARHPKERIQQALARESEKKKTGSSDPVDMPPFIFLLNITLPGSPLHHMLFYYAVDDMSTIDGSAGTPFSKIANQFFFGDSDEFRDHTFKLIPQIVEGNFIVRRAVGSTPAIMGTKLKQHYIRDKRFFELILDVGSSSVAAGVTGLAAGYAKNLVVDMAFVLEGNDESTLPEKVLGCCRLKNVDLANCPRFCEQYEDVDAL